MIYSFYYLTLFGYPHRSLITFVHVSKKSACFPELPEAERKTPGFLSESNPSEFSEFLATFPTCSTASSVLFENNRQCDRSDAAYANELTQQNELFCSDVSPVLPKLCDLDSHNFASLDCRNYLPKTMVQSSPPPASSGGSSPAPGPPGPPQAPPGGVQVPLPPPATPGPPYSRLSSSLTMAAPALSLHHGGVTPTSRLEASNSSGTAVRSMTGLSLRSSSDWRKRALYGLCESNRWHLRSSLI